MNSYIWDLDGTILDSYAVITEAVYNVGKECGIEDTKSNILFFIKRTSVKEYLKNISERADKPLEELYEIYSHYAHKNDGTIKLIDGVKDALKKLKDNGAKHYVYTHRGVSSEIILKRLDIYDYFEEIVTSINGFPPKPSGEGLKYLIDKYKLDPEETCYVGDRSIDVLCAKEAGIKAILFLPFDSPVVPTSKEDLIIDSFSELTD